MRLEAAGSRSINNVVDATNYILLEVGQPMHAYDLAKLAGPALVARRARAGELLTTLDGVRRTLTPAMTVIADAQEAQGVGGVMGGAASEVSAGTTDIVLEAAYFDPRRIRATRRALGMSTEASYRFERGMDRDALPANLARALELIVAVAGGAVDGAPVDVLSRRPRRRPRSSSGTRASATCSAWRSRAPRSSACSRRSGAW